MKSNSEAYTQSNKEKTGHYFALARIQKCLVEKKTGSIFVDKMKINTEAYTQSKKETGQYFAGKLFHSPANHLFSLILHHGRNVQSKKNRKHFLVEKGNLALIPQSKKTWESFPESKKTPEVFLQSQSQKKPLVRKKTVSRN